MTQAPTIALDTVNERFFDDGYLMPVEVFTSDEAASLRQQLEQLEAKSRHIATGNKTQLNFPHLLFTFAAAVTRNERLLDVVERIIGPNIMVWGSTFFIKEPRTRNFVSWHQDMKHWGLDDTNAQVSAWIALNDVTRANGCMQFLPKTHLGAMVDHRDTIDEHNILTRGQEADIEVNPDDIVHAELRAGQASFHHGKLLHSSPPNPSGDRRIGYAIQFIAPHMRQQVATKDFAMLVRGEDQYGHFEHVAPPAADLTDAAIAAHHMVLGYQNEAMYAGVNPADAAGRLDAAGKMLNG